MRKKTARAAALALTAVMALTACGGGQTADNGGSTGNTTTESGKGEASASAIKDLVTYESPNREQESFFILNTEKANDLNVLCNLYSPLVEVDNMGKLQPAVATEWGTEDGGLTWTFKLRDDVKWVDINGNVKADCTAQDWITAMEWVLNFHKNSGNNTSMPLALIAGAEDYYNYTKELPAEEAMALDTSKMLEMVGIEAPDDYTLIYHCAQNAPYFDTVATSACLYPISQALIDELGVENMVGMTNENMWYNGPYFETTFTMNNEKVLTANPTYWDKDAVLFDTVTVRMVDATLQYQLWQNGELDNIALSEADLRTIYDDENNADHNFLAETRPKKFSYQMHFNFDKKLEDGTPDENWNKAVANEAFRLSMYYGLDLNKYWARTNFIAPLHCENVAYTMKGLLYYSDGTDYVDKVIEKLGLPESDGTNSRRYDAAKAEEYKKQAMEELAAKGVTFPVNIDYYIIAGDQNALDKATVLKQVFAEGLGEDYVNLNIKTYVSSQSKEVVQPALGSFYINGWGADYGDPANFIDQERYGYDQAYYSMNYSRINEATDEDLIATYKEFSELAEKAGEIYDDMDARYDAYVDAEVYLLQHALTIPMEYEIQWQLTKVNDYSKMNAMFGAQNYTYKNWETSVDAYTTEQYEAFQAAVESK
ncbi:MAG: hypothetical protein KHY46_08140 [Clostridiales bacterium]|nr:hypothetical protein [Clostridiales bacterium]